MWRILCVQDCLNFYSLILILLQKQPHEARCTKTMTTILYVEIKVKRKTMGVNNLSISYGKDRSMWRIKFWFQTKKKQKEIKKSRQYALTSNSGQELLPKIWSTLQKGCAQDMNHVLLTLENALYLLTNSLCKWR